MSGEEIALIIAVGGFFAIPIGMVVAIIIDVVVNK